MDPNALLPHIEILTGDPSTAQFQESYKFVDEYRASDKVSFLNLMSQIYSNDQVPLNIRHLALILSYQLFPSDPFSLGPEAFTQLGIPKELIEQLLTTTVACFNQSGISNGAATLYSRIACIDVVTKDEYNITKTLIQAFQTAPSEESFNSLSIIMADLFQYSKMDAEELNAILSAIFQYLSASESTDSMRNHCLRILRSFINNLKKLLVDEEDLQNLFTPLFTALFQMSQHPPTKAEAFRCWTEFAINYYPMLEVVATQLAQGSFLELAQGENDDETIINICLFWKSIAECELDKKAELRIIDQAANILLPLLFQISTRIPTTSCDNVEDYFPHIAAADAMQSIVKASPEQSAPVLLHLLQEYSGDKEPDHFGVREAALNCLNFLIQFSDCSSFLLQSLDLIYIGLHDVSPRVKQVSTTCVHAILNSILTNPESCPFLELIPKMGQKIVMLATVIIDLVVNGGDVNLQTTAALTTADFIRFPGFPNSGKAIILLLQSAVSPSTQDSLGLSQAAFSALQSCVTNCPIQLLPIILNQILEILQKALEAHSDFWIINQLCYVLQSEFIRLKGQIDEKTVQISWVILEGIFTSYPDEAISLLIPLATLARASGPLFQQYLNTTAEFISNGLKEERDDAIQSASLGVLLLSDSFDLSPFSVGFLGLLTAALSNPEVSLQSKSKAVNTITELAMKTPEPFVQVAGDVMKPIVEICSNDLSDVAFISDDQLDDETETSSAAIDEILYSFIHCLKTVVFVLAHASSPLTSNIADALNDLLEIIGGMKEHADMILQISIDAMATLIQVFPDQMKETFQFEPGFIVLLKEAEAAEISPEVLAQISAFLA